MGWDIAVMDVPADAASLADLAPDFAPASLGERALLISKILEVAPTVDFSDRTWGELTTPNFTVEFNMGRTECVGSFMLHVRGGDESVIVFVSDLLSHLGLRAIDCPEGDFLEPIASSHGFGSWQDFRAWSTTTPTTRSRSAAAPVQAPKEEACPRHAS